MCNWVIKRSTLFHASVISLQWNLRDSMVVFLSKSNKKTIFMECQDKETEITTASFKESALHCSYGASYGERRLSTFPIHVRRLIEGGAYLYSSISKCSLLKLILWQCYPEPVTIRPCTQVKIALYTKQKW